MSASYRKRQASPSEVTYAKRRAQELVGNRLQARARSPEDHHQIRVQRCCNCAKIYSTPHTLLSCNECDHIICTRCPVDDPLLLFPHPGLVQQRYEDMNKEDGDRNLGMLLATFGRDQEHEMSHNAEEEKHQQELQLQPQPQPTGKQRQVETGVPIKRSLNMNKCERCRLDKKKCVPVDRVWPTRCDLCIKKGFSCSESKRVVRLTKHAPATTPSPMNTTLSTTSGSFEEHLKEWSFLLSYRKMILAAKDRLQELEDDITSLFPSPKPTTQDIGSSSYSEFSRFAKLDLANILYRHSDKLLTQKSTSQDLPGWFLITHLDSLLEDEFFACSKCSTENFRSSPSGLGSPQDTCGELLLLHHRAICHDDYGDCSDYSCEYWDAHVRLSHEVQKRASELFESYGLYGSAECAKSFGVYHPDVLRKHVPDSTKDLSDRDCLERSQLHMCMDDPGYHGLDDLDVSELKDRQDILGRTPLLIACREGWYEDVDILLEEEADPGLTTIYGSLPLHYAAAKGLVHICEQLLAHKTRFDIKAKDCVGKTALDYAREKKHQDVANLLSVEYAALDRLLEELERALR